MSQDAKSLMLAEAVAAYFKSVENEHSNPWQDELRDRIKELASPVRADISAHCNGCDGYDANEEDRKCKGLPEMKISTTQAEGIHHIIERWSTDVVDYEHAADDIGAYLFGGVKQPEASTDGPV